MQDYIIQVDDASNPQRDKQMYIVYETLDHLGRFKNKKNSDSFLIRSISEPMMTHCRIFVRIMFFRFPQRKMPDWMQ